MEDVDLQQLKEPEDPAVDQSWEGHLGSNPDGLAWSQVWQFPVLLVGMVLLVVGVYMAIPSIEKDDFPQALDEVEQYVKASNLRAAEQRLLFIKDHIDSAGVAEQVRFNLLWGDLIYVRMNDFGRKGPEFLQKIIGAYIRAQEIGYDFDRDGKRLGHWARVLAALGRFDEALAMLDRMELEPPQHRYAILKDIAQHLRAVRPMVEPERLIPIVTAFLDELRNEADQATRRSQTVWGITLQASLYLESGNPGKAIDYLNPRRAALASQGGDNDLVPLIVLSAKAYQELGDFKQAEREYTLGQLKLATDRSNALHGDILVGQARIALAQYNDVEAAIEHFSTAVRNYPTTPAYLDALIGQADCAARRGTHGAAREYFSRAVQAMQSDSEGHDVRLKVLLDAVLSHHHLYFDASDYDQALEYLSILSPLYKQNLPPDLLLQFALTHEQIASVQSDVATVEDGNTGHAPPLTRARRMANRESAVHFTKAGDYYYQHAGLVTIIDDQSHGESLWRAATCYDRGHMWQRAIDVYTEFRDTHQEGARQLEATRLLALAYKADGQYHVAANLFRQIIEQNPRNQHAHASRVPLARCYIALEKFSAALTELNQIVSNHEAITPESIVFHEAMIELGKLHYRMNRYEQAISRLEGVVDRYGSDQEALVYAHLADAYRRSIDDLDDELASPQGQVRKVALVRERKRRLKEAGASYTKAINILEAQDQTALKSLEKVVLRNNYFYRADCAYKLGEYNEAIEWYDQAAKRWDKHPATLVARMQIVNAYCALEQFEDAKLELDKAQYIFNRLPQDAFEDSNLPITRKHWQDWFHWTSKMRLFQQVNVAAIP